ncbi:MAG: protein-tyrosine phosphatase, partial [Candidatus Azotimanducaceae bacterium]
LPKFIFGSMKVLMVCLGNICRSPLAEGVLRHKSAGKNIIIDSAGTAAYHINERPDERSISKGKEYGIDVSNLRGRQFKVSDFEIFDFIFAMDQSNYENIVALAINEEDKSKVKLILNETHPGKNLEVPDPYYGGAQGFEDVYQLLDKACDALIQHYYHD